jgi:O-antigen/teichoic acid export membrane protein
MTDVTDDRAEGRHTSTPGRSYAQTAVGSVIMLALNLMTGVLTARLLAPDGRGAVGAILGWAAMLAFLGGMGYRDGLSYAESRDGTRSAHILTSAVVSVAVLGVATLAIAELLVPLGFRAQTAEVVDLARIFLVLIIPTIAYNTFGSLLGSRHRFGLLNLQRVAQPLLYAGFLAVLWILDAVTVAWVLAANLASFAIVAALVLAVLARESGFAAPDRPLVGEAARYGLRAYGGTIGQLANVRLDLMVMPAILVADEIGYYVVAVSAASMVSGVFGSVEMAVFPLAARLPRADAVELVQRTARVTLFASLMVSAVLAVAAPILIDLLYGSEFSHGVPALRLLLPGIVMWSTASVIGGGLKALGHPQQASIAQLVGAAITVTGLVLTLRPLGIEGAAITSSLAYTAVFVMALRALVRLSDQPAAEVLDLRRVRDDVGWLAASMRGR